MNYFHGDYTYLMVVRSKHAKGIRIDVGFNISQVWIIALCSLNILCFSDM